ncbi:MAG: hypothetical protein COT81_04155 [Candidatus Buchananbacteria bacterium CG10_big_fil_rev_8_21_14_0_10_42_9]|uniref:Uncharacterized protein n=1 Tax=Candidatus Buchananbacteria bacterium CG10_big_fil_rev_8_21_14_0_10_42_9 TaxID=1974526 RepID=A0A2H0W2T7_9BACT|nr:MAG: hypothetical protein COT81_04155 [Candidatus Buchananbacteria bacterium CG10_big_fil_rev_8_21_14_0_10_42_9]
MEDPMLVPEWNPEDARCPSCREYWDQPQLPPMNLALFPCKCGEARLALLGLAWPVDGKVLLSEDVSTAEKLYCLERAVAVLIKKRLRDFFYADESPEGITWATKIPSGEMVLLFYGEMVPIDKDALLHAGRDEAIEHFTSLIHRGVLERAREYLYGLEEAGKAIELFRLTEQDEQSVPSIPDEEVRELKGADPHDLFDLIMGSGGP